MRILLINPEHDDSHHQHKFHHDIHRVPLPIGLLYVATSLKNAGYHVDILDTHVTKDWQKWLVEYLVNNKPMYVDITVIIGQNQRNADEITQIIHGINPDIPIVWGVLCQR